ncbi:MAG: ThuA domain-containing protein [Puia sp.]|nr:ThuA domain-containing protein [Puia sp.]
MAIPRIILLPGVLLLMFFAGMASNPQPFGRFSHADSRSLFYPGFQPSFRPGPGHRRPHPPIKVLIVDGFSNHNWQRTTRMIREILERSGLFRVDVSTAPPTPAGIGDRRADSAWAAWRPRFSDYDVVIQNTNNIQDTLLRWPRPVEAALEKYVRGGGGLYILHSANNAFPHWKEYDRMIGLGWRSRETGYALEIDDGTAEDGTAKDGTVKNGIDSGEGSVATGNGRRARPGILRIPPGKGEGTNHGDRTDATIRILHRHPLNQGFPDEWKTANMEIYRYARGPAKRLEVLSYAYDSASRINWPVEWIVKYGRGHVYNSSMGHLWKDQTFPISYKSVDFQTIVVRVTEWLGKGKVTAPVPVDFPTRASISTREWESK